MSFTIGDVSIDTLVDGEIRVPARHAYPRLTEEKWAPHRRWLDPEGNIVLPFGAFLIRARDRVVLVDTGAGVHTKSDFESGNLLDDLRRAGAGPEDVTDVVLTHLHWDHVGWTTRNGEIVFPNATYRCDVADWTFFMADDKAARKLAPLEPRLETWSGSASILPDLDTLSTPGHTPGHTAIVVSSQGERAIILGDAAHCPMELEDNEVDGIGDVDVEAARRTREWIAARLEETQEPAIAPHFPMALGRMIRANGVRRWVV